jgi:hypothetical protein
MTVAVNDADYVDCSLIDLEVNGKWKPTKQRPA